MPYRKLPDTDEGRLKALQGAKNKADSLPGGAVRAFSDDTLAHLDAFLPNYNTQMQERGSALSVQSQASLDEDNAFDTCALFISHFIQVFNFGIERGVHPASARAFYQLDVNQEDLPRLTQESDVTLWGKNLIDGEAARVTAGGTPMQNPNIAQVTAKYNDWIAKSNLQSNKKDSYDKEQEDVAALREECDDLILDIWDEVEFTFRKDEAPSKRRKCREYGVVYVSRPGEEPEEGVLPPVT